MTVRRDDIYAVKDSVSERQNLLGFVAKIATTWKSAVLSLIPYTSYTLQFIDKQNLTTADWRKSVYLVWSLEFWFEGLAFSNAFVYCTKIVFDVSLQGTFLN